MVWEHFPIQMCVDTYEELLWLWSFTVPVVAVVTLTTATEVMQSLEDRRLAHAGLTKVAIIILTVAQKIFFDLSFCV